MIGELKENNFFYDFGQWTEKADLTQGNFFFLKIVAVKGRLFQQGFSRLQIYGSVGNNQR